MRHTRTYKAPADYDSTQDHFTIETIEEKHYLKIGALNTDDQRFIESLIANGHVGFFDDSDERVAFTTIEGVYDEIHDCVEVGSNPTELIAEVDCVIRFSQARPGNIGEPGYGNHGEHAEIEIGDTPDTDANAPGIRMRVKSGGEENFGDWFYVEDGEPGADANLGNLIVKTRGAPVVTSSNLPRNSPGSAGSPASLHDTITWSSNSADLVDVVTENEISDERKFALTSDGDERGIVHVPFRPTADNVDGFWLVCEDLNEQGNNKEIYAARVGWGPGPVEVQNNNFTDKYVLAFGIRPSEDYTDGDDVLAYYYKGRRNNYKPQINIFTHGTQLPSNRCRIRIYLAGVFISIKLISR